MLHTEKCLKYGISHPELSRGKAAFFQKVQNRTFAVPSL